MPGTTTNQNLLDIAEQHNQDHLDIAPKYYDLWLEALIDTVIQLDDDFTPDVELAWRIAFMPGVLLMQHFHSRPTPITPY